MNVIFLDYDGVLNTKFRRDVIDYENLERLKMIVKETNSSVVISSSIKNCYVRTGSMSQDYSNLINRLLCEDINVIGCTEFLGDPESEISSYLQKHPEIINFVILHDDVEMKKFGERMIKVSSMYTEPKMGLNNNCVSAAIRLMKKNNM